MKAPSRALSRRRARAETLMRIAGVRDLKEACEVLASAESSLHRRCLAAKAIGLIGDETVEAAIRSSDPGIPLPLLSFKV